MKSIETYQQLQTCLDELLEDGRFDGDKQLAAEIGSRISMLISSELDSQQLTAIEISDSYRSGLVSYEKFRDVEKPLERRMDEWNSSGDRNSRSATISRLMVVATNTNSGFDEVAAEYIIGIAESLSLDLQKVTQIFRECFKRRGATLAQ